MKHIVSTKNKANRNEAKYGIIFALPAILGFFIFTLGPMLVSLVLSFTNYAIVNKPKFVGFENYIKLFNGYDPFFYKSILVTGYYVLLSVPLGIIFHFSMALLMNRNIKGKGIFRALFYLPSIIPVVATCTIWMWLFNPDLGLLNYILMAMGFSKNMWLSSEVSVMPSIVMTAIWIAGNTMVIFLAALQDVPRHLYEAIDVDGGKAFHKLFHITIPMTSPTIFFNTVMGIISGFQVVLQPMIMTDGGPNNSSLFYGLYLYREGFKFSRMGNACAMAWVLFMIIMLISALVFRGSNKLVYYEGGGKK